jgi:ribosomal protein S28E/S33
MAGWRVGFCLGNPRMIAALARIKSYLDYGVFQPVQIASIIALRECEEDTRKIAATYQKRRDVLVDGLKRAGLAGGITTRIDVRVGAVTGTVSLDGIAGVFENAAGESAGGGIAWNRIRADGRGSRAFRADRKSTSHAAGHDGD